MQKIITIDGPSGSGKGTVSALLANGLGWRILDSGALYRLVGHSVDKLAISHEDVAKIAEIALNMQVEFDAGKVHLNGEDVSIAIRTETAGNNASKVAAMPEVRQALLQWQRDCACEQGLIADGRDMGTTVFPDAPLKVFLTASPEIRAERRYKQLIDKGLAANIASLVDEIRERDERDQNRKESPLRPAGDAMQIDSSELSIDQVVEQILQVAQKTFV